MVMSSVVLTVSLKEISSRGGERGGRRDADAVADASVPGWTAPRAGTRTVACRSGSRPYQRPALLAAGGVTTVMRPVTVCTLSTCWVAVYG